MKAACSVCSVSSCGSPPRQGWISEPSARAPQAPATIRRSKLLEARYRDGAAVLGFQSSEVIEGGDAFAEVS